MPKNIKIRQTADKHTKYDGFIADFPAKTSFSDSTANYCLG
jgi:hypothetical protein